VSAARAEETVEAAPEEIAEPELVKGAKKEEKAAKE
jgi:hypothetical protein